MKLIMGLLSVSVLATVLAFVQPGEAQEPIKVLRVGLLSSGSGERAGKLLRKALRELGYVEGQNIVIETRAAKRNYNRLPALAGELVRLGVDVLFTASFTSSAAAKNATKTVPIVFLSSPDPVATGLVDNLARPEGNLTGATYFSTVLAGKRLELLKELIPKLSRVGALWQPGNPGSERIWKESQLAAQRLDLQLHSMEVRRADQFEDAFHEATKAGSTALTVTLSALINANRKQIANLATKNRLPAIYGDSRFVRSGGLMSYATDRLEQYRRAATYIDKIFKGAKPGDLPVEQPTKFELLVNMKAAKQIGVTIPPSILYRADKVIR